MISSCKQLYNSTLYKVHDTPKKESMVKMLELLAMETFECREIRCKGRAL